MLLYDGACRVCTASAATIERLDLLNRVTLVDATKNWASTATRSPRVDRVQNRPDVHLVTRRGTILTGVDAYRELARVVPIGWPILPVLYLPGVLAIGRAIYRRVTGHPTRVTSVVEAGHDRAGLRPDDACSASRVSSSTGPARCAFAVLKSPAHDDA